MTDDDSDLVGKLGVIEEAESPYHGEIVKVLEVEGSKLTVELHDPEQVKAVPFAKAWFERKKIRML